MQKKQGLILLLFLMIFSNSLAKVQSNEKNIKNVEIVFVIDTTGSMGGLIEGAKTKVWSIVNEVMQNNRNNDVEIKIGLIAYRDKGDEYVTKISQLNKNLDLIYKDLMEYKANGGGDTPEDVRKALYQAVNDIKWSKDKKTTKIIFLVGDAPPQEQYGEEPSLDVTSKKALKKGIIINTIQCGNMEETIPYWKSVAQYGGGEYFSISQNGGVVSILTPYDKQLIELNSSLNKTVVYYGDKETRNMTSNFSKMLEGSIAAESPLEAQVDRVVNKAVINAGKFELSDLTGNVGIGNVEIKDIKNENLPENMQKMSDEEKEEYMNNLIKERERIQGEIVKVSKQRDEYILEQKKNGFIKSDGFDDSVSKALKTQIK